MGKKILKLLLYLMAVVGVLIWLDSTVGLTEEGALIIFGIALLMYFVMKLIGFLTKRRRIRRERARKARRKRELREVNNYRGKQETGRKAENNRSGKWKSNVETYVPDVEQWKENVSGSGWQRERSQITSVAATAASQANHRKQQKLHNQSGHKFQMTQKKIVWIVGLLATFCIVVLAGKTWIRQHEQIPESLLNMEEKYPEATDFVKNYPKRRHYQTIDISSEVETARENSEIPYFLQWDERWGYETYGSDFLAVTGCGPTCLSMITCGLTGSETWNPLTVAQFSEKEGYYVPGEGTSWSLMTEGASNLGLTAENIPVTQENILAALQSGIPLICSMYPGDFTYTGHFIVLTGIDENGAITVNDPNSPANTKKHWSMTEILPQIRQTWGYRT